MLELVNEKYYTAACIVPPSARAFPAHHPCRIHRRSTDFQICLFRRVALSLPHGIHPESKLAHGSPVPSAVFSGTKVSGFPTYLAMANTKSATPSQTSTRVSHRTSVSRVSMTSPPMRTKTRGLSNASLQSNESNASGTTLKPNGAIRSSNVTHTPTISPLVKRMSVSSIPTPTSRRQSMPVSPSNGPSRPELSPSNSFSQVMRKVSTPPSLSRPRHVTAATLPPTNLLEETFPFQEPIIITSSTPRNRVSSYTPPRKANTFDSAPSTSPKPSPSPQKTPAKRVDTPKSVSSTPWSPPNTLDRKNGKAATKVLVSESPSRPQAKGVRGGEVFPVFDAMLDGDDMTLELVTELNEGEVDEDVSVQ